MSKELKTQWHPAFCSAIKLELKEDKKYLEFYSEYNLNSKPLEVDMLIIKKISNVKVKNEIGRIFRQHNLLEYKSPDDSLNIDTLFKVIAYACLYKANEEKVDEILPEEITITLVRKNYPRKLIKWLEAHGFIIKEVYPGIYYLICDFCFPIQVLVTSKLSEESQKWIILLRRDLKFVDVKRVVKEVDKLSEKDEQEYADSVLQVAISENEEMFKQVRMEDDTMCEALRKLMEPEISEALAEGRKKALAEGREKGLAEGREEGLVEANKAVIINALNLGKAVKEIVDFTGISLDVVEKVHAEWMSRA